MSKIHLRIVYGADQRYSLVRNTVLTHHKYFESVVICNTGPEENSKGLTNLLTHVPKLRIFEHGRYQNLCNDQDMTRYLIHDIPNGDWVVYLDSDWRLPEYFLKQMYQEVDTMEQEGRNHLFSYQLGHHLGEPADEWERNDRINYSEKRLLELCDDTNQPQKYGQPILQKIDKENTWCDGFLGNHNYILHVPYNKKHIPRMFHFHFRDYKPPAYCGSMIPLAWWYMGHHVFSLEEQLQIQKSWEYRKFEEFKDQHKCYTANQLQDRLNKNDIMFIENMKSLFLSFEGSKIFCCQQMYDLASKYNMKFYKAPEEYPCTGVCCLYDGKYIKDYPKI